MLKKLKRGQEIDDHLRMAEYCPSLAIWLPVRRKDHLWRGVELGKTSWKQNEGLIRVIYAFLGASDS